MRTKVKYFGEFSYEYTPGNTTGDAFPYAPGLKPTLAARHG